MTDFVKISVGVEYLPFLDLGADAVVLPPADDDNSSAITNSGGIPFGRVLHESVYVRCVY